MDDNTAQRTVQILTTVHFTLATERAATINEANGRSSLYLTTVSACLVALGFIAKATKLGTVFYVFTFGLFTVLALVGIITFNRVVQTGIEDWVAARGIDRIQLYYQSAIPGIERWFMRPVSQDRQPSKLGAGHAGKMQILLTTASMVAVVTCALLGVLAGLVAQVVTSTSLIVAASIGLGVSVVAGWFHYQFQSRAWTCAQAYTKSGRVDPD